jgi:hypothetical protein
MATATKRNKPKRRTSGHYHRKAKAQTNRGHRRSKRNSAIADLPGLATTAVFTIAGAVGAKYLTQMVLTTSNTGVMGYIGNLVAAFILSYGTKAFMKNDKAASAVLAGGIVQVVLRLIADYTPFGSYTSSLGMGDYLAQIYSTPQHLQRAVNWPHSAALTLQPTMGGGGMSGYGGMGNCNQLYGNNNQYAAA